MKTSELIGPALRWAVATLEGYTNLRRGVFSGELVMDPPRKEYGAVEFSSICYDTDWSQGGPIIEREMISVGPHQVEGKVVGFCALGLKTDWFYGPTPLIAAMRCYVASKLGDEVNIPEELT